MTKKISLEYIFFHPLSQFMLIFFLSQPIPSFFFRLCHFSISQFPHTLIYYNRAFTVKVSLNPSFPLS
jgi:hypothetical protein